MFTIENLKNRLINHSVALKHTFDEKCCPLQGTLVADKGTVFFVPAFPKEGERFKWVMTTVSKLDDANLTKIECNRMAKEFVKKCPCPWLAGYEPVKGKYYNYNGKILLLMSL